MPSSNGTVLFIPTAEAYHRNPATPPDEALQFASLISPNQGVPGRSARTQNLNQPLDHRCAIPPRPASRNWTARGLATATSKPRPVKRKTAAKHNNSQRNPATRHVNNRGPPVETDQQATYNLNAGATEEWPDAVSMFGNSNNNDAHQQGNTTHAQPPTTAPLAAGVNNNKLNDYKI